MENEMSNLEVFKCGSHPTREQEAGRLRSASSKIAKRKEALPAGEAA
jgi:hypothetical protein